MYHIFLDPPTVTAPKLKCVEGCCLLPIITVSTNNNDLYLVCNVSNLHDTIVWHNGDTVAKGTNYEEVILPVVVWMTFYYFYSTTSSPITAARLIPLSI